MPPICTHELRILITGGQSTCCLPTSRVLSSPKDSRSRGGDGGMESGSLCPNLGVFGCDEKDTLIAGQPMTCLKASAERNARAAALHHGTHPITWPVSSMHWESGNLRNVFGLCILERLKIELLWHWKTLFGAYKISVSDLDILILSSELGGKLFAYSKTGLEILSCLNLSRKIKIC